jgi:hypothetical protein
MVSLDQEAGVRFESNDDRVRPSRRNSTERPMDEIDQRNGCSRVETVGTGR